MIEIKKVEEVELCKKCTILQHEDTSEEQLHHDCFPHQRKLYYHHHMVGSGSSPSPPDLVPHTPSNPG
ncbi:hypothetical protein E2C01_013802 [Portunus trituberculatus]|uniref:Uncharacterized protein n=1 Tax=Portunus trituberculatus TaxID=210409 RepID=A0A5B7DH78_PORTR|nr:hypothetical protein [Portunus trituberculatus]